MSGASDFSASRPFRTKGAARFAFAALLAALALLVYAAYRHDIGRAYARIARGSEVAQTACGPIEYAAAGDGPAVLVVHGAGGGFDQGMAFAEPLVRRGFRVIAVSRFGYLRTPLPADASPAAQADAHACLLDALGVARAAVVGGSAGAPSAMQFALRHPERISALALVVPIAHVPRADAAPSLEVPPATRLLLGTVLRADFLFWAATRLVPESMVRAVLATPPEAVASASADEQARVHTMLEHVQPIRPRQPGLANDVAVLTALPRYELERIAAPTLVVSLADDLFGSYDGARYTAEHIPGARFVGYPSGGHVWAGRQDQLMAELAGFLR